MRIEIEEIKRVAEEIVEIAEGSGEPFAEKVIDQIAFYVGRRKFVADEVIDLVSHVAVTVKALNEWRVANGMKAL
jgi:hypothetical protein